MKKLFVFTCYLLFTPVLGCYSQEIFDLVKANDTLKVKALVENNREIIFVKDKDGRTPLHWACRGVYYDMLKFLVDKGADVNARDINLVTPLISLVSRNSIVAAKYFLSHNADPNIEDAQKQTPLHYAASRGQSEMVKLLLDYNASHEMRNSYNRTPLVFFKTTKHLIKKESNRRAVETAKLESDLKLREAELRLLRGQIQPHFLFNTLNNLYSLSIHQSEKTSEVIIKLSDLLNYIIYDCHSEKVKIESEIDFLKSFIELEQIRHDESLKVSLSIEGNYDDKYIAPMLLHTFIENSFKHGANKTTGTTWIDIEINIREDALIFKVANSKSHDGNFPATGIGIMNTKKRLNLIYPDKHKLEITETENVYSVFLEIKF